MPTDWKKIAEALDPPVEPVVTALEALETKLDALSQSMPIDTLPWDGR